MLKTGAEVDLTLEKPVAGGRMLARHEGQVVLVAGAIPGERVCARIDRVSKGMAFATTLFVRRPSPGRREAVGDPLCGGTVYAHVAYAEQAAIKREVLRDALRHGGRIEWPGELPVTMSPELGYRMRARLHVRKGKVGFFREGTHDLCDCAGTGQLRPGAVEAARAFVDAAPRGVRDAIDAIELTESIAADQCVFHVQWAPHARVTVQSLEESWDLERLQRIENLSTLTGVSCADPSAGFPRTVSGQPWVSDPLDALVGGGAASVAGLRLRRHAASFFQANRYLAPNLVAAVHRAVMGDIGGDGNGNSNSNGNGNGADGDRRGPIVDLYAGVGLFAITLAALHRDVEIIAVEGDPSSARDLSANAEALAAALSATVVAGVSPTANAAGTGTDTDTGSGAGDPSRGRALKVEHSSVELYLDGHASAPLPAFSTLIVDPPRTGMSKQALDGVLRARASRLVYVSCDVATLSRDLRRMIDAGYRLDHLEAFDLFPNTAHVESLAVLSI